MSWKKTKIGEFLKQYKDPVEIKESNNYNLVTVSNTGNIYLRKSEIGLAIKSSKLYKIKEQSFIYSRLSIHNGAFGLVPKNLDGAVVSDEMPVFKFDEKKINKDFFLFSVKSNDFIFQLSLLTKGVGRVRVKESNFLNLEISLPSLVEQKRIAEKLKLNEEKQKNLQLQITNQKTNLKNLRKQILQDAVEGKLTKEWREKNPDIESASELLKKIKKEKEKLISEKKIKKEKPLPEINKSEIPFELPESWIWTRIGEIIRTYSGDFLASYQMSKDGEIPVYGGNGVNGFHDKYNVSDQKIVIGRVGAYCGSIHLTPEKAWVTDNSLIVSFSEADLNKKWLVFLLKVVDLGKLSFNGSQPVISGTKIYSQTAPLPPLSEQLAIVSKLQTLMQKLDEAEKQIEKSLETSKLLTKAILVEAFKSEV